MGAIDTAVEYPSETQNISNELQAVENSISVCLRLLQREISIIEEYCYIS